MKRGAAGLGVMVLVLWPESGGAAAWSLEQALAPQGLSLSLKLLLLLTALSLAPALLIMVTSFTRLVVVFAFLRHALGTQQLPPNQILIALALFLTLFIMAPVWQEVHEQAVTPYVEGRIQGEEALTRGLEPLRRFMYRQTREKDLALFVSLMNRPKPQNFAEVPTTAVIPAFMISELRTAFEIGFLVFLPFLIIDMVVASVLLSMGMMMLPPVMVSLVFKVLLFVLVDGWNLVVGSLVRSFH
ncbi:MAG: flagellar type III secretion system pore protein FliP [Syntrophobacterales bacterium]|jgi:flagellar biosynthetic protein FliP|nr:flagellar type III secretion system pore protein FliP [Syntrophobacterales bacterium]